MLLSPRGWASSPASFVEQSITLLEASYFVRTGEHLDSTAQMRRIMVNRGPGSVVAWTQEGYGWEDAVADVAEFRGRIGASPLERLACVMSEGA